MQRAGVAMLGMGRGSASHRWREQAAWPLALRAERTEYTATVFGAVGGTRRTRPTVAFWNV